MNLPSIPMNPIRTKVLVSIVLAFLFVLAIPERDFEPPQARSQTPFTWSQSDFWEPLEKRFQAASQTGCSTLELEINAGFTSVESLIDSIGERDTRADDARLQRLEQGLFELSPLITACDEHLPRYASLISRTRQVVKLRSIDWEISDPLVREKLYRLLYGSRAALETALLQADPDRIPDLLPGLDEPSSTPSITIHGVKLHSGDLLVSRGGAPTSALIARGNDFPGNFSHVALLHIDDVATKASVIEAHIESGVGTSSAEDYLRDKKLRIMVLRPRADHPLLQEDPMLPHKAASFAVARARNEAVPYDFSMNFDDPAALFCSEVASEAYATRGMTLWMGISHISSPVTRKWMSGFGVRHFTTQAPSDLEYDPGLVVVAEWRGSDALWEDALDNAVIDAMLQTASPHEGLPYSYALLPVMRIVKLYSILLNQFGKVGPIPEGMSATAALRNHAFTERAKVLKDRLRVRTQDYKEIEGHLPPRWTLRELAVETVLENS